MNRHYENEMEQLSRSQSKKYWDRVAEADRNTLQKYALVKSGILHHLSFVDPDDMLLFWSDLAESATPIVVEASQKSTKPHSAFYFEG